MDKVTLPDKTVGCQQLINSFLTKHHGFLRWKSSLNKLLHKFSFINWSKAYVLLHDGCLYIFKSELSTKPLKCTSLVGFSKCRECEGGFELVQSIGGDDQVICFSAPSLNHTEKWIEVIENEIQFANMRLLSSTLARQKEKESQDEASNKQKELEECELYFQPESLSSTPRDSPLLLPSSASTSSLATASSGLVVPSRNPHPSAPPQPQKQSITSESEKREEEAATKTNTGTHTGTSHQALNNNDTNLKNNEITYINLENPDNFFWYGDPNVAESTMKSIKKVGAYMIRNSTSDSGLTLLLRTDKSVAKFKITKDGSNFKLEDQTFSSLDHLLIHFHANLLPKTNNFLMIPYTSI